MSNMETWRLLISPSGPGAQQMAQDQAIAEAVQSGASPPTLRFYTWWPRAISLGYRQPVDLVDRPLAQTLGVDIVRRVTGGDAILHSDDLTYAIALPQNHRLAQRGVLASYMAISDGLVAGLTSLGLRATSAPVDRAWKGQESGLCYLTPSRHEIWIDGYKIVASAQGRIHGGVLQHGSLLLSHDDDAYRLARASVPETALHGIRNLLPQVPTIGALVQALTEGLHQEMAMNPEPGSLSSAELRRLDELARIRYADTTWLHRC